jgi:hypothetical protein
VVHDFLNTLSFASMVICTYLRVVLPTETLRRVNVQELLSTQISEGEESKIEGVVARWVETVDIIGLSCHHAM